jgi:hypothetical protein
MPGNEISTERKEQAQMRLLPPYSWSLRQVAKEVGTSPSTRLNSLSLGLACWTSVLVSGLVVLAILVTPDLVTLA